MQARLIALTISLSAALLLPMPGLGQNPAPEKAGTQGSSMDVARLFSTSCGFCHQQGGRVQGRGPKLMGLEKSDEEIIKQIKFGKPPRMPAFGKSFSEAQIQNMVAYIRSLKE
jgi:mono/diheme cytochrome c family protein